MAKKPVFVDQLIFSLAVKDAEKNGALGTLGELYEAIAKSYVLVCIQRQLNKLKIISATIAKDRLNEWKIETLTKPGEKGRTNGKKAAILDGFRIVKELMAETIASAEFQAKLTENATDTVNSLVTEFGEMMDQLTTEFFTKPEKPATDETEKSDETTEAVIAAAEESNEAIAA